MFKRFFKTDNRMTEKQEILSKLYEKFEAHEFSDQFFRINFPGYEERLSVGNPKADDHNDRVIHITVSEKDPEKFDYQVLNNKGCFRPEQYLVVEKKEGASSEEIMDATDRWLIFEHLKEKEYKPFIWDS